jgi:hypothetical protein
MQWMKIITKQYLSSSNYVFTNSMYYYKVEYDFSYLFRHINCVLAFRKCE